MLKHISELCFQEWLQFRKVFCIKEMRCIRHIEDCSGCPIRIKEIQLRKAVGDQLGKN